MKKCSVRMSIAAGFIVLDAVVGLAAAPSAVTGSIHRRTIAGTIDIEAPGGLRSGPQEEATNANPLWAIPLKDLTATRERPIFSPSRRPPAPAVVAAPFVPSHDPPKPARPLLTLVGTIVGDNEGFGIFLDQSTNKMIRLKLGQDHERWVLRRVSRREVIFEKDRKSAVLVIPAPDAKPAAVVSQVAEKPNAKRMKR